METYSDSEEEKIIMQRKLEENALTLAKRADKARQSSDLSAFIAFSSGGVKFLIEAGYIIEVVRYREVVPLPGIDKKLAGIYNFRGTITGVYSVDALIGESDKISHNPHYILICSHGGVIFALACDDIAGIENRSLSDVKKDEGSGILKNIFSGVFPDSARLLDMDRVISDRILEIS